jgi:hypothetical protein
MVLAARLHRPHIFVSTSKCPHCGKNLYFTDAKTVNLNGEPIGEIGCIFCDARKSLLFFTNEGEVKLPGGAIGVIQKGTDGYWAIFSNGKPIPLWGSPAGSITEEQFAKFCEERDKK